MTWFIAADVMTAGPVPTLLTVIVFFLAIGSVRRDREADL